jgi:hypothetical protein
MGWLCLSLRDISRVDLGSKSTFWLIFPKGIYFVGEHVFSRVELIQLRRLCLISNLMGRVFYLKKDLPCGSSCLARG